MSEARARDRSASTTTRPHAEVYKAIKKKTTNAVIVMHATHVDHGLEHLSGDDHRLPLASAAVNNLLLGDGHHLRGHFHAEVAAATKLARDNQPPR